MARRLPGLQLESRGRDEVAQLDGLRLTALMDRIDCDLALGRHEQALGELGVLVREHPRGKRLRAQQMLALYRAGRQAEALDAYAEARRTLVDDLGIEPSDALQRLQQAILRHDPVPRGADGNGCNQRSSPVARSSRGCRSCSAGPAFSSPVATVSSARPGRGWARRGRGRGRVRAVLSTHAAAHRKYTIAYVTPNLGVDYVQTFSRGSRSAARRLGVRYRLAGGDMNPDYELSKVYQKMIARHVDAIVSQGYDPTLRPIFRIRPEGRDSPDLVR